MDYENTFEKNKIQQEVEALKGDMKDILSRLTNLKNQSKEIVSEQFGEFITQMNNMGDKGTEMGKDYYYALEKCVKDKPMSSTLYAFFAGIVLTMLIKR